jgi:hypothetical protein
MRGVITRVDCIMLYEQFPLNCLSSSLFKYYTYKVHFCTIVEKRIRAGWMKWKTLSGVLCDKSLLERIKRKVFEVAIRPAMTYSAET